MVKFYNVVNWPTAIDKYHTSKRCRVNLPNFTVWQFEFLEVEEPVPAEDFTGQDLEIVSAQVQNLQTQIVSCGNQPFSSLLVFLHSILKRLYKI